MGKIAAIVHWDKASVVPQTLECISASASAFNTSKNSQLIQDNLGFSFLPTQPAQDTAPLRSDDGRFSLVCDARIDNRQELLKQLFSAKEDASDTAIILKAYQKWQHRCPAYLIGDFAFIIWDKQSQTVFAARDAMNMRTLSYSQAGNSLLLATEGAQLLAHPEITAKFNRHALTNWLSGWPDPNVSMFEGIKLLLPGHCLRADAKGINIERYWTLDPTGKIHHNSVAEYEDQLREILSRSVGDCMHNTKEVVASQMSGGMDSTSVTALAHQLAIKNNKKIAVISHTYKTIASCDESERINDMLQHLGINNVHYMAAEQHAGLDFRELYPPALENPGTVCSPRYTDEMKLIKTIGADVLLTGSGGDEMVWGHSLTYLNRLLRGDFKALQETVKGCKDMQLPRLHTLLSLFVIPLIPRRVKQSIRTLRGKPPTSHIPDWIPAANRERLEQDSHTAPHFKNRALQARYDAWLNSSTINSVRSYQQAGELFGIEVRHPFFDRRLLEFSFAIPDDLWIRDNYPKWLLRRSMTGRLPDSVCWSKNKIIFDGFFGKIIRDQKELVRTILSDPRLEAMGLVDNSKLLSAFDAVVENKNTSLNVNLLYALMAQIWFQKYAHLFP